MATVSQPKRHASQLFRRHHSNHKCPRSQTSPELGKPYVFEGTDTVTQNRTVALQRIVEVHDAFELKHQAESATAERPKSSSSMSSDHFNVEFHSMPFSDTEVRAFRYFVRKWDRSATPDPEFDAIISTSRLQFEEAAIKHFFRRIALWNESEEIQKATKSRWGRNSKSEKESELGKMWAAEKGRQEHALVDGLKEVTTREGLAQLLWTLMHDPNAPLAPELLAECTEAVKWRYGIRR